ncbi:hypothetical protein [Streptomyces chattanoogensis]|uniref:Uncharacterized protein n=1 Tax=Streptomyces chattanoogensis TaxID=66876 RepID=A0A0N0XR14_9ACTN|nr:hypothetical protein [Streptomyces chattanoogensis]KPC59126.1 hypothetical protein ADL29_36310 [Streptomyces chattanoogensis]
MYLTDTLADLADDRARGVVALPDEILDAFPGAEADLLARRWTPPVRDLIGRRTDEGSSSNRPAP